MRINRYLASCGIASRRQCEQLILEGKVTLNGRAVTNLATTVQPGDAVTCEGKIIQPLATATVVLHKPPGVLCTASDPKGRMTIYNLLPPPLKNLKYVGRLDHESEGLLLLTNDGDLNQRLTHPSHKVEKEYWVSVNRPFQREDLSKLLDGIPLEEGLAKADAVRVLTPRVLAVVLHQGLNRQIRRMFAMLEYEVERLVRVRIGDYEIGSLKPGKWKHLHEPDLLKIEAVPTGKSTVLPPVEPERGDRRFAREETAPERPRRVVPAGGGDKRGFRSEKPSGKRGELRSDSDGARKRPALRKSNTPRPFDRPTGGGYSRKSDSGYAGRSDRPAPRRDDDSRDTRERSNDHDGDTRRDSTERRPRTGGNFGNAGRERRPFPPREEGRSSRPPQRRPQSRDSDDRSSDSGDSAAKKPFRAKPTSGFRGDRSERSESGRSFREKPAFGRSDRSGGRSESRGGPSKGPRGGKPTGKGKGRSFGSRDEGRSSFPKKRPSSRR